MKVYAYLWTPMIKGRQYSYYRRDGQTVRLVDETGTPLLPGDPGFWPAYRAAATSFNMRPLPTARPEVAKRSLQDLITEYRRSDHWKHGLSPATRNCYARRIRLLEDADTRAIDVTTLTRPQVLAIQTRFATNATGKYVPSRGNEVVKMVAVLCAYAVDLGWTTGNPAARVKKAKTGNGHITWTPAAYETFLAHPEVDDAVKRAVVVAYRTGLRVSDLVKLPHDARVGGIIRAMTQKTGASVAIPQHPDIVRWLDAAPVHTAPTLLVTPTGKPWSKDHLERCVTAAVRQCGLDGLSLHGCRMAAVARLAEAGCSDSEIESWVPHSAALTRWYRRHADQNVLSKRAMEKLLAGGK